MKTLLLVEDVALNRDLLVQLLEEDYLILTATDGAAGIELAMQTRPDLILRDLSLPVLDGWEATRRLKANAALQRIPIIALTAYAMTGDEERTRASGCDGYLSKPINEELLFATLHRFLDNTPEWGLTLVVPWLARRVSRMRVGRTGPSPPAAR